MSDITGIAILALFPLCMIFATFTDLFSMTIPNKIVLALIAGFAVLAPLAGMSLETAIWSIGISVLVLIVGFVLFNFGAMGGGDAKLMAAYILSLRDMEIAEDVPLDARGQPYPASRDYQVAPRLTAVHPGFALQNIAPEGFQPKVGGMDFAADGSLLLASWDIDGAVYRLRPQAPGEPWAVQRIAEGLQEPLGLAVVGERIFVLQKQELTELIDSDGDGVVDIYRAHARDWRARNKKYANSSRASAGGAAGVKLGRVPLRVSAASVNWGTSSNPPSTSLRLRFIFPSESEKTR